MNFQELYNKISKRIESKSKESYVVSLVNSGTDRILQKIIEEAGESVIALKNTDKQLQIEELTDLFFHLIIAMKIKNISIKDIEIELKRRDKS